MNRGDLVIPKLTPWRRVPTVFHAYEVVTAPLEGTFVIQSPSRQVPIFGSNPDDYELFLAAQHRRPKHVAC